MKTKKATHMPPAMPTPATTPPMSMSLPKMTMPTSMGVGNMGVSSMSGSPMNFGAMMGKMAADGLGSLFGRALRGLPTATTRAAQGINLPTGIVNPNAPASPQGVDLPMGMVNPNYQPRVPASAAVANARPTVPGGVAPPKPSPGAAPPLPGYNFGR